MAYTTYGKGERIVDSAELERAGYVLCKARLPCCLCICWGMWLSSIRIAGSHWWEPSENPWPVLGTCNDGDRKLSLMQLASWTGPPCHSAVAYLAWGSGSPPQAQLHSWLAYTTPPLYLKSWMHCMCPWIVVQSINSSSKWPGCVLQSLKGANVICSLTNLKWEYKILYSLL